MSVVLLILRYKSKLQYGVTHILKISKNNKNAREINNG